MVAGPGHIMHNERMEGDEIRSALGGGGTDFDSRLVRLVSHADSVNRERLRRGFPEIVKRVEKHLGIRKGKPLVEIFASDDAKGDNIRGSS